jgi:hypothetical protein
MLSAKKDSRGYPVSMNRVELARAVDEGWASVTPGLIMLCAVKCGVARVEDFDPDVVEREGLRTIHIDPIIADIVGAGIVPPRSELQELSALMGLDAEIEEDLEELEGVYSAMEELQDIIETGVDAESLDIDHGTVMASTAVPSKLAIRRKNKDIADEISCLNGAREVSTEDVRNWMSSKRHAARNAVPE